MYKRFFKRLFDLIFSGLGIAILSPLFIILTPIVAIAMRGNPFFVQERPGKNGSIFKMIKYRTMNNKRGADGELLPDKDRLTKFGRIMRALSIDELPELFNIFCGKMSIVGPRPLLVRYLPLYDEFQSRRHEVRPGLTGLAQVSGRNAITWAQKFEKDVYYVDNCSLALDIKIFFLTIKKVFAREGISQDGQATMEFFTGNGNAESGAITDIDNINEKEIQTPSIIANTTSASCENDKNNNNTVARLTDNAKTDSEITATNQTPINDGVMNDKTCGVNQNLDDGINKDIEEESDRKSINDNCDTDNLTGCAGDTYKAVNDEKN